MRHLGLALVLLAILTSVSHAYTLSDLYGSWDGTFTPTTNATLITASGVTPYTGGSGYYGVAQPDAFTFGPSTNAIMAFKVASGEINPPPGFTNVGTPTETAASFTGTSLSFTQEWFFPTTDGGSFDGETVSYIATMAPDPSNSSKVLITGSQTYTWVPGTLPADSSYNELLDADGTFSLTQSATSSPTSSVVPAPSAFWSALATIIGLGAVGAIRRRFAVA
jgi:hypothetical protein